MDLSNNQPLPDIMCFNNWTPEQLALNQRLVADGRPVRYFGRRRRMNLWRTFVTFVRFGRWCRWELDFEPVFPWESRYEEASYETTIIFQRCGPK